MVSLPSLPFDVLTEIILHSDLETDIPTLRALSMACRATVKPSQRRLFNTIEILVIPHDCDKTQPIYSTLNDIFNSSPHLATYVSHLTVKFGRPYPDTSCIVPALEKLSLIQSLRIKCTSWVDSLQESPRWGEVIGAILRHPSLRRLDLEDRGLLPSIVWQLPALTSIDLDGWRIEEPGINYARHSLTRRLAMSWDMSPDPQSTLRSFLKISPRLTHLRVTQSSDTYFLIIYTTNAGQEFQRPGCHKNARVADMDRLRDRLLFKFKPEAVFLWLYGAAGSGKSSISQTFAVRCAEERHVLGSFNSRTVHGSCIILLSRI